MSFLLKLFNKLFVLEAPMIQRLLEVLPIHIFKVGQLVVLLGDQILKLVAKT